MTIKNISKEKGAVSGIGLALLVIVLIAIAGIGWIWARGGVVAKNDDTIAVTSAGVPNTGYTYTISSSTPTATVAAESNSGTVTRTYTTYEEKVVPATTGTRASASAYTGVSGSTYHNATYGLTLRLPSAGYRAYVTAGGPAGLPGTAQIHFVAPGESADAFVVNVWNKEGWNYVRTRENFVHENTTNIGEGTYLGENFTWIYSYIVYSHAAEAQAALSGAVFY